MKNRLTSIAFMPARVLFDALAFKTRAPHKRCMPTLTRLLVVLALIAAVVFGAMLALAYLVKPVTHEMTIEIPPAKIRQSVIEPQAAQTQPETGAETAEQGGN